jgi:hypothetical protein
MKRCPQCEFIYEDDQNHCDMDGAALVFEAKQFPAAITSFEQSTTTTTSRSKFAVVLLAGLLIGAIGLTTFYVSTRGGNARLNPQSAGSALPSPSTDNVIATPTPSVNISSTPARPGVSAARTPAPTNSQTSAMSVAKPTQSARASIREAPQKPITAAPKRKPPPASRKEESPVESFLKKTGRILKKPFKF